MIVKPLHGVHAIENVSFGIEWTVPLLPPDLTTLETIYDAVLQDELPSKKPVQSVQLQIGGIGEGSTFTQSMNGFAFERFSRRGTLECNLVLNQNSISFTSNEYTRWDDVFEQARKYMSPFLSLIDVRSNGIKAFGLQYTDVFRLSGDSSRLNICELLNRNSRYLPASVFDQSGLWHSHHGYLQDAPDISAKRLTIVNCDLVMQEEERRFNILTMHRTVFDGTVSGVDRIAQALDREMRNMHIDNKSVLADILNPEVSNQISLESKI